MGLISSSHRSVWLRNLLCVLLLGLGMFPVAPAFAEDPRFPLTAPEQKRLIVERVYQFYMMRYAPPVDVRVLENAPRRIAINPDLTAIAFLSAQAQGNYEWYVSLLSDARRKKIEAEQVRTGKAPQDLAQEWQERFANRRVVLTHYVKRGPCSSCPGLARYQHSIIRYQVIDPEKEVVVKQGDLPITVERGRGWVVSDLTGDLIYENWDFQGSLLYSERIIKE